VELDGIDPQPCGTLRGRDEGIAHAREVVAVQCGRRVLALLVRDRRRRDRLPPVRVAGQDLRAALPRNLRRGLAAGMRQLDGDGHVGPAPNALQGTGNRRFRRIVPESHVGIGDPSVGQDGGRLYGQQRRAREGKMAEVNEVPVGHAPVDGRVLAHRRDDDAVGQFLATNPKWCEQRAHAPPRAVRPSTRTSAMLGAMDFLLRGEELLREGALLAAFRKNNVPRRAAFRRESGRRKTDRSQFNP
jgi:hypothetical protein